MRCDYAVNEGAGDRIELGGRVLYLCSAGREAQLPVRPARPGPERARRRCRRSPTTRSSRRPRLIERLGAFEPEPVLIPEAAGFFEAVADSVPPVGEALALARSIDPVAAEMIEPLLGMTVAPTMISASAEAERDPGALRGDRRLPAPARPDGGGRGRARAVVARRGRLRGRVAGQPRAAPARELGTPLWRRSSRSSPGSSREPGSRRSASRGSPTLTGCARRSEPSPTGSSRCAR